MPQSSMWFRNSFSTYGEFTKMYWILLRFNSQSPLFADRAGRAPALIQTLRPGGSTCLMRFRLATPIQQNTDPTWFRAARYSLSPRPQNRLGPKLPFATGSHAFQRVARL